METVELPSDHDGNVDMSVLRRICRGVDADQIAGMMITVPSTLGLFDVNILEIIQLVHEAGGLMYMDGANMNALMGIVKPGDLGFDVMHYNLHKTFSTPHGGGGPGSGAVSATKALKPYLPGPIVDIVEPAVDADDAPLYGFITPDKSIGRLKAFQGNFGMYVRAYAYIRRYGAQGLRDVSRHAVLNANYMRVKLQDAFKVPYPRYCGHEFVIEGRVEGVDDIHALDICKRLIDYGYHPPTNYFPLIVPEALLIEPTETETKDTLDDFIEVMKKIANEAKYERELLTKCATKRTLSASGRGAGSQATDFMLVSRITSGRGLKRTAGPRWPSLQWSMVLGKLTRMRQQPAASFSFGESTDNGHWFGEWLIRSFGFNQDC